jgi:4-hydroxy-tetrahydrodipicolinate synthase
MMPGTGCCSIAETVKLTAQAVKHGCAGVLMLPPFYYKGLSEEGLYRYFSEVVQRVGDARLRIYLYHIPPVAMVGITTGLVERLLAAYPNAIAGMKDSSGDWNNTKTFLDAFTVRARHETSSKSQTSSSKSQGGSKIQHPKDEGAFGARRGGDIDNETSFDVFVGSESFLLANMRNGGVGTISATANVNPAAIYKLYAEYQSGKLTASPTELEEQQAKLNVVRDLFGRYPMIAALKQAIAIYEKNPAWAKVRPPLVELTAEQAKNLAAELKAISFTMPGVGK